MSYPFHRVTLYATRGGAGTVVDARAPAWETETGNPRGTLRFGLPAPFAIEDFRYATYEAGFWAPGSVRPSLVTKCALAPITNVRRGRSEDPDGQGGSHTIEVEVDGSSARFEISPPKDYEYPEGTGLALILDETAREMGFVRADTNVDDVVMQGPVRFTRDASYFTALVRLTGRLKGQYIPNPATGALEVWSTFRTIPAGLPARTLRQHECVVTKREVTRRDIVNQVDVILFRNGTEGLETKEVERPLGSTSPLEAALADNSVADPPFLSGSLPGFEPSPGFEIWRETRDEANELVAEVKVGLHTYAYEEDEDGRRHRVRETVQTREFVDGTSDQVPSKDVITVKDRIVFRDRSAGGAVFVETHRYEVAYQWRYTPRTREWAKVREDWTDTGPALVNSDGDPIMPLDEAARVGLLAQLTDFPPVLLAMGEKVYSKSASGVLTPSEHARDMIRHGNLPRRPESFPGDDTITVRRPTRVLHLFDYDSIAEDGRRPLLTIDLSDYGESVAREIVQFDYFDRNVYRPPSYQVDLLEYDPGIYQGKLYRVTDEWGAGQMYLCLGERTPDPQTKAKTSFVAIALREAA